MFSQQDIDEAKQAVLLKQLGIPSSPFTFKQRKRWYNIFGKPKYSYNECVINVTKENLAAVAHRYDMSFQLSLIDPLTSRSPHQCTPSLPIVSPSLTSIGRGM